MVRKHKKQSKQLNLIVLKKTLYFEIKSVKTQLIFLMKIASIFRLEMKIQLCDELLSGLHKIEPGKGVESLNI